MTDATKGGKLKLNLGCGNRKREGFVNVDAQPGCRPDLVLDLETTPWPWPDDSVDEIDLIHVLEHLGQSPAVYLSLIRELWRICCDGARVRIVVPHPRSDEYLNDPTHVRPVTEAGLEMFSQRLNAEWEAIGAANTPLGRYLGIDFEIESSNLDLKPRWLEKLQRREVGEAEIRLAGEQQFNVFSQLTVILRAVKPAGRLCAGNADAGIGLSAPGIDPSAAPAGDHAWRGALDAALAAGDLAAALHVLATAVADDPRDHEARAHLATLQHAAGLLDDALANFRQVAESGFGGYELYNNLGVVAQEKGLADEAVAAYENALALDAGNPTVRANLAEALGAAGRVKDAVAAYESLLQDDPQNVAIYVGIAQLFISQAWFADALAVLESASPFGAQNPERLNQKGIALRELGRHGEALAAFEAALAQAPDSIALQLNRANALARLGRDDEAETAYRAAIAAAGSPCPYELGFAFACFLLQRGRTDEGWRAYDIRRRAPGIHHHPLEARLPQWRGEAVRPGERLLVTAEQGFGDNIQFIRLLPALKERFGRICLLTRPALYKLFARSLAGVCEVVEEIADVGSDNSSDSAAFDWTCPIASLPLALSLPVSDWGMSAPYLKLDTMQSALWGFRIPAGRQRKVGLCWSGGKALRYAHRCDLPQPVVEALLDGGARLDLAWVSLQKGGNADWRRAQAQAGRLIDLMDLANNFDDTASLIANLDLVITVDTSVAHVAGALGKPVWLLLAQDADWRWLENREDSPWYPGMRLFRQATPGDWAGVGQRVLAALQAG